MPTTPARITILAHGTRGDAQPGIALGKGLAARGHTVTVLASAGFETWIRGHGLHAAPSSVDVQALMATDAGQEWSERGNNPLAQLRVMRHLLDQFGLDMANDCLRRLPGRGPDHLPVHHHDLWHLHRRKAGHAPHGPAFAAPRGRHPLRRGHDERTPAHPQKLDQLSLWQSRHPARRVVDLRQQRQPFPPDHPRSAPPNPIRERGPASPRPLHPLLQPPRRAPGPGLAEQCADHGLSFFG